MSARWFGPVLVSVVGLIATACCDGPISAVDCVGGRLHLELVDAAGSPVEADQVLVQIGRRDADEASCTGGATSDTGGELCSEWHVFAGTDGTYTVDVFRDGELLATETFDLFAPKKRAGECCGGVISEQRRVEIP